MNLSKRYLRIATMRVCPQTIREQLSERITETENLERLGSSLVEGAGDDSSAMVAVQQNVEKLENQRIVLDEQVITLPLLVPPDNLVTSVHC